MRNRITSRDAEAAEVLSAVAALEKSLKADDATLKQEADGITKEDIKDVTESVPAGNVDIKEVVDQNAKANDNWPVSDKEKVASRLVALAKSLLDDSKV